MTSTYNNKNKMNKKSIIYVNFAPYENAGKILDKHEREDIKRLQYIIRKRYKSIPNIVDKLNQIIHFLKNLFQQVDKNQYRYHSVIFEMIHEKKA